LVSNAQGNTQIEAKITNFLDIIHRLSIIKKGRFGDWSLSPSSGKTALLGQTKELVPILRRWIMSGKFVILIIHHCHKPSNLIYRLKLFEKRVIRRTSGVNKEEVIGKLHT
jgi:hypothetical protein